jgi:hypothetical protein
MLWVQCLSKGMWSGVQGDFFEKQKLKTCETTQDLPCGELLKAEKLVMRMIHAEVSKGRSRSPFESRPARDTVLTAVLLPLAGVRGWQALAMLC